MEVFFQELVHFQKNIRIYFFQHYGNCKHLQEMFYIMYVEFFSVTMFPAAHFFIHS